MKDKKLSNCFIYYPLLFRWKSTLFLSWLSLPFRFHLSFEKDLQIIYQMLFNIILFIIGHILDLIWI